MISIISGVLALFSVLQFLRSQEAVMRVLNALFFAYYLSWFISVFWPLSGLYILNGVVLVAIFFVLSRGIKAKQEYSRAYLFLLLVILMRLFQIFQLPGKYVLLYGSGLAFLILVVVAILKGQITSKSIWTYVPVLCVFLLEAANYLL